MLYVTLNEHPTKIQTNMTLPPDPTQFLAHCKAHKADTQKPTLQKSLPCATALATLCGATQTHILADREEGRTYNKRFAARLADGITIGSCTTIS